MGDYFFSFGTHIRILRSPIIAHHAIIVGWTGASISSPTLVIDNAKGLGVSLRSLDVVAAGDPIEVVEYPQSDEHARVILERARRMVGSTYAVLNWNCEHFCRWCYSGVPQSYQLQTGMFVGAVALGLVLITSNE